MRAAQGLYENGYITYMRTDSTTLSDTALSAARAVVAERYGRQYLPDEPRRYANKTKNAQEAHEAIRPAGESFRSPEAVAREVNSDQARLYELIWKRTVASQMTDAVGETVTVRLGATTIAGRDAEFSTSGTIITHQGFRLVYIEDVDERSDGDATERQLPPLVEGDPLRAEELTPQGHQTQPPARFTEASLVKRLEELGVGRPSTYASIIQTIQERGYVWKKGAALVPSFTAFAVTNLLEQKFDDVVDYAFTARLEDDLDAIARGDQESVPWLARFYWGHGDEAGLRSRVDDIDDIDARAVNSIPIGLDPDGVLVEARAGRYGPFLSRGEDTASIPDDLPPDELTVERALELLAAPKGDREVGVDPETGRTVYARAGRFGPYVQLGEVEEGSKVKPPTASLFKTMSAEAVTLEEALRLLSLPRIVGVDPADGTEITAQNGRYGPYIKKGSDSRSLETEEQLFTITLEECLKVLAEPKRRRGQTTAAPLRELGEDPSTGRPMVIKDGRFGPYVTDGETNASLRKGDEVETLTVERGSELLADRRSRGPVTRKRGAKKAATKKAPAKKAAAKRSAKKASAKKAAAKKAPAGRSAKKAVPPGDA
jgi:DNA topoisomerase-1